MTSPRDQAEEQKKAEIQDAKRSAKDAAVSKVAAADKLAATEAILRGTLRRYSQRTLSESVAHYLQAALQQAEAEAQASKAKLEAAAGGTRDIVCAAGARARAMLGIASRREARQQGGATGEAGRGVVRQEGGEGGGEEGGKHGEADGGGPPCNRVVGGYK